MNSNALALTTAVLTALAALAAPASAALTAGSSAGATSASTAAGGAPASVKAVAEDSTLAADPAIPVVAPAVPSPDAYRREIEGWRAERLAGLKSKDGWLTVVGLFWLDEGENRFGSDPANRVVLPAGKAPGFAGTLVRHGGTVTVRAQPGSGLESGGHPVTEMELTADATGKPTTLQLGSLSFFIIKRGDRLGARVKDSQSPALSSFHGVESFPADPSWRVVARFEPHSKPQTIAITNVLGMTEPQPSPGVVIFEHGGTTYRLDAVSGGDDGSLFLIFADPTNRRETYGAGRFLDTEPPSGGKVVVDFNKSYNPPCAFTAFATCPLPPKQNRLTVAVTAGEKRYAEGHP